MLKSLPFKFQASGWSWTNFLNLTHLQTMEWCRGQIHKLAIADWAKYVRPSSGLVTIVVMTLFSSHYIHIMSFFIWQPSRVYFESAERKWLVMTSVVFLYCFCKVSQSKLKAHWYRLTVKYLAKSMCEDFCPGISLVMIVANSCLVSQLWTAMFGLIRRKSHSNAVSALEDSLITETC